MQRTWPISQWKMAMNLSLSYNTPDNEIVNPWWNSRGKYLSHVVYRRLRFKSNVVFLYLKYLLSFKFPRRWKASKECSVQHLLYNSYSINEWNICLYYIPMVRGRQLYKKKFVTTDFFFLRDTIQLTSSISYLRSLE